ncbi:MAG: DUF2281 domain-containing protein [Candidatus Kapabacteria bacterium]|nr:DUF2281 domain-containing protein [Candidatus Kapabacteria bacterium]
MDTLLLEKIDSLPESLISEVDIFVDYLLFKTSIKNEEPQRTPGFLKGKVWMADDFDEPLEEFKEYM